MIKGGNRINQGDLSMAGGGRAYGTKGIGSETDAARRCM
jgi:hypothetical protein